jgi:type I restriction enzyme S subunit
MAKLESVISSIRDILRKEGITGMDSINHCIAFLVSRMLTKDMCKKVNIDEQYSFENILLDDNGEELGNQEFFDKFYKKNKVDCFVGQLVNKLGFKNIKFKMEGIQNLKTIMRKLQELDLKKLSSKYDLIGTIYEIHLKSGTSNSMRDLGQYYTHRLVIKYMIELCKPEMNKGVIDKIIDPTMGTGGFLSMSIKYLKDKYDKIDWAKNKDNLIGFDIDDNVKNMALLNVFLECGEMCTDTLVKQDTLHNDFKFSNGSVLDKAKIILANEPMGLKNIVHAECCDRIKDMKIRGTKAEPLFLQLFMEALDKDGRCAVIVPDGVLFNESNLHNGTRKHLIENYNLKKVVSLNDDFFLNTGVKTSILFFVNDGKTKKVEFCEIKIKDDDIVENSIIKVNYDKLKSNNYSLFVNKYNVIEVDKIEGIEYKKLGEVCEFKNGKTLSKKDIVEGIYKVIGGGKQPMGSHNKYNRDENTILCSSSGANAGYISKYKIKTWASDCFSIAPKDISKVDNDYIFYTLSNIQNNIYELQTGSAQPHMYSSTIENLEIPIPSLRVQQQIVERLDVLNENNATIKKNIDEFKKIIKYYVDCQTMNEKVVKLGEICETESGDYIKTENFVSGKYPVYGGGDISKYINKKNRENTFVISKDGVSENCVRYIIGEFFLNHHGWTLNYKDKHIINKFMFYCLIMNQERLYNLAQGSAQKGINRISFYNMQVKIPSKEKQQQIVDYCDNLSDIITKLEKQLQDNKLLIKNIIDNYLNTKDDKSITEFNNKNVSEDFVLEEEIEGKQKINKKMSEQNESDSEPNEKTKHIKNKKKVIDKPDNDSNNASESEPEETLKIIKKLKKEKKSYVN